MSITIIGILIIILCIYSFIFDRDLLYRATIFFLPFSATAVFNVGSNDGGSAVIPYMVMGSFWILSLIVFNLKSIINYKFNKKELLPIFFLSLFGISALISLIMPIIINGKESGNISGHIDEYEPIVFSSRNITQLLYLAIGILFSIAIYATNKSLASLKRTIKIYANSTIFISIWGVFELFCKTVGIQYPDFIFNNSVKTSWATESYLENGASRITSVTAEPSILNQTLIIILPFFIIGLIKKNYIYNKYKDSIYLFIITFVIIRSASASGLISLVILTIITFSIVIKPFSIRKKIRYTIYFLLTSIISIVLVYFIFQNIITELLFNKADSYSGLERLNSILDGWDSFISHPILGMGWGSVSSMDLFVKILSNTGIIGCLVFTIFLINTSINLFKYNKSIYKECLILSFLILILNNSITTFGFVFGYFWLIVGFAFISFPDKNNK